MSVECSYCGTGSTLQLRSKDYNRRLSRQIFNHYRCPKCALTFISPVPTNLDEYYPPSYYFIPEDVDFLKRNHASEQYKIKLIQRFISQGRLLEIGPALGAFAHLAKHSGFAVEAIEMDKRCSKFLNEVADIPTINTADTFAALEGMKPFDVIALWHVIEHLPNPWRLLELISKKLNLGGILILAAPNPSAFQFHIMGRFWPHLDAPRHLMLLPCALLQEKMASLGMTMELSTTADEGGIRWNTFGWEFFFSNICSKPRVARRLRWLGRKLAMIASPIERIEGKGCTYTLVFRKRAK